MNKAIRTGTPPTRRDGRFSALTGVGLSALLLGGCAQFTADAGLSTAREVAAAELNKDVVKVTNESEALSTQQRVEDLLRRPLTPDSAVQIAFLKNRGLQAAFNDLGIAEATYVQATLPPAPRAVLSQFGGWVLRGTLSRAEFGEWSPFWNAPFGAARPLAEIDDLVAYFAEGEALAAAR